MRKFVASAMPDLLMVAGWASISYGAWLLHPAAGAIVCGLLLMAAGVLAARKGS